jgi:hypothetical protein
LDALPWLFEKEGYAISCNRTQTTQGWIPTPSNRKARGGNASGSPDITSYTSAGEWPPVIRITDVPVFLQTVIEVVSLAIDFFEGKAPGTQFEFGLSGTQPITQYRIHKSRKRDTAV